MKKLNRWLATAGVSGGLALAGVMSTGVGALAAAPLHTQPVVAITVPPIVVGGCGGDRIAGPDPSRTTTLSFCRGSAPLWLAFQNDGGPWTQAKPDANNVENRGRIT